MQGNVKVMSYTGGTGINDALNGPAYVIPESKVEEFLDRYGRENWEVFEMPRIIFLSMGAEKSLDIIGSWD